MDNTVTKKSFRLETITAGVFSERGNFTAYNAIQDRFFVSKQAMETAKITTDEEFAKAGVLYALVTERTFNEVVTEEDIERGLKNPSTGEEYTPEDVANYTAKVDENGKVQTFTRSQATAIFNNKDKAIEAFTASEDQEDDIAHARALKRIEREAELFKASFEAKKSVLDAQKDLSPEMLSAITSLSLS